MKNIIKVVALEQVELYKAHGWSEHARQDNDVTMVIKIDNGKAYDENVWIEPKRPYLIQRMKINKPLNDFKGKRFFESNRRDYMGSAEFEWGALPESLTRLRVQHFLGELHTLESIRIGNNGNTPLRFWCVQKGDELNKVKHNLETLWAGTAHTKEWTHFMPQELRLDNCDLWWDISNDVIFGFDKQYMNRLTDHLEASWEALAGDSK